MYGSNVFRQRIPEVTASCIASKQAQVPKTNIRNVKRAILEGCGYKDELRLAFFYGSLKG